MSSQTDDERRAWDDLVEAVEAFDKTARTVMDLVRSIDALIEAKVAAALEEFADRIEDASGVRP